MQHLLGFIVRLFYLSCVTIKKIKQLCMVSMTNKIKYLNNLFCVHRVRSVISSIRYQDDFYI